MKLSLGVLAWLAVGCSSSQTIANARVSAPKTPPANAAPVAVRSAPKGIPIDRVEVFEFAVEEAVRLFWACDGDVVYVWGTIELENVGRAELVIEADEFGFGWLVTCGDATLAGCSADIV